MGSLVRVQAGERSLAEMRGFFVGEIFPSGLIHEVDQSREDNLFLNLYACFSMIYGSYCRKMQFSSVFGNKKPIFLIFNCLMRYDHERRLPAKT